MPEQKADGNDRWLLVDNTFISMGYHSGLKAYPNDKFYFEFYIPAAATILLVATGALNAACQNKYYANGMAATEPYNQEQYTWGPIAHDLDASGADTCFVYDIGALLLANGFAAGDYVGLTIEVTQVTGVDFYKLIGVRVNDVLVTP